MNGRAGMHSDVGHRKPGSAGKGLHDPEAEPDRPFGFRNPDHDGVPYGFDLLAAVAWEEATYRLVELGHKLQSLVVTVGLSQGGKAREIGEQERLDVHPEAGYVE